MNKKLININFKSFLALILISILMLSIASPVALAVANEDALSKYESDNSINNNEIDFSSMTLENGEKKESNYEIKKEGTNYTIKLKNLTASKVILPKDDNDIALSKYFKSNGEYTKEFYKDLFRGVDIDYSRKTHVTIELEGTNKINGYGLVGGWLKGVTIKGSGSLEIITHKENDKPVAGISLETDEIKDGDDNTGFVIEGTNITIKNPYYWGIDCNGDMKLKGNSKVEVESVEGESKSEGLGDIKVNKLYKEDSASLKASNKILVVEDSELTYELNNKVKGEVLDFSDTKTYNFEKTNSYASAYLNKNLGNYSISKNGSNYTIILDNLVAKKIILPYDDADLEGLSDGDYPNVKKDKARKTHITIILKGNSKITGYGIEGHYVKGLTIKGEDNSSLDIVTHLEPRKEKDKTINYVVPGISIETDEIDDKDKEKGFVLDNAKVTITNPYYWGIVCNGDMDLTNKSTLKVKSYTGIKKRAEAGDISTDKLFVGEGSKLENSGKVVISKQAEQRKQEREREKAKYKDDVKAPEITLNNSKGEKLEGTEIEDAEKKDSNGKITIYCEQPTITVTDDQKIDKITVNGEKITVFKENTDKKKVFVVPEYLDCGKTLTVEDMNGNKATITFRSNSDHVSSAIKLYRKDATCTEAGYEEDKLYCLICNKDLGKEKISLPALGHSYGNPVVTSDYKITTCTRCGDTETVKIEKPKAATPAPKAETKKVQVANTITASNFTKTYSTKAQSFNINAKRNGNAKLTYKSNNKNITVNSSGKVTVKAKYIGKATITISSVATSDYKAATKNITVTVNPPSVKLSKLTNKKSKKMVIKWAKNTAVTGYQIQYSTDKNFKKSVKTVTVGKNKTVTKTVSKLSKNKKYYVRVRTYKTVSGVKYYSSWSNVKNIKIKK